MNTMPGRRELAEVMAILISLALLIAGTAASLLVEQRWVEAVSLHLGGLGVVGLLASRVGHIARKRGRDYRTAFLMASVLPISLGAVVAMLVFFLKGFVYCGGGVVLLSTVVVALGYLCLGKAPSGPV